MGASSVPTTGTTQPRAGGWQEWPTPRGQRALTLILVLAVLVAVPLSRPVIGEPYT